MAKAKPKARAFEDVERELREVQDRESRLMREIREIPAALSEAEREGRVDDILSLRRRGEELPVHIWSASKARIKLSVEARTIATRMLYEDITRLSEEAEEENRKAVEARDRATALNNEWHDSRAEAHEARAMIATEERQLENLEERGPNYRLLEELTNQARGIEEPRYLKKL